MESSTDHFWLYCAVFVGGGNAFLYHFALAKHVKSAAVTRNERKRFVVGFALAIGLPSLLLWGVDLIRASSIQAPPSGQFIHTDYPEALVFCVCWLLLLRWVFFDSGAQTLSKMLGLATFGKIDSPLSATVIKILCVVAVASGVPGMIDGE